MIPKKAWWYVVVLEALLLMCPLIVYAELMTYYGTASTTSAANLGVIDLAFTLEVSGTAIQPATSYVMLDKTLLFPVVLPKLLMVNNLPVITNGTLVSCVTVEPACVGVP